MAQLIGQLHNKINKTVVEKTVALDFSNGNQIIQENGKVLRKVTITKHNDFVAANIRNGKTLGNIAGTFSYYGANGATASDIRVGKTAAVNGNDVAGSMPEFTGTVADITANGPQTISAGGKFVPNDISFNVNVPGVLIDETVQNLPIKDGETIGAGKFIDFIYADEKTIQTGTENKTYSYCPSVQLSENILAVIGCNVKDNVNDNYIKIIQYNPVTRLYTVIKKFTSTTNNLVPPGAVNIQKIDNSHLLVFMNRKTHPYTSYPGMECVILTYDNNYDFTAGSVLVINPNRDTNYHNNVLEKVIKLTNNRYLISFRDTYSYRNVYSCIINIDSNYSITKSNICTITSSTSVAGYGAGLYAISNTEFLACWCDCSDNSKETVCLMYYDESTNTLTQASSTDKYFKNQTSYSGGSPNEEHCQSIIKINNNLYCAIHASTSSNYMAYTYINYDTVNDTISNGGTTVTNKSGFLFKTFKISDTEYYTYSSVSAIFKFTVDTTGIVSHEAFGANSYPNYKFAEYNPNIEANVPYIFAFRNNTSIGSDYPFLLNIYTGKTVTIAASIAYIRGITLQGGTGPQKINIATK